MSAPGGSVTRRRLALHVAIALLGIPVLCAPRTAHAEDRDLCLGQHVEGQELRRLGRLRAARDTLRACARDACPTAVRVDCAQWATEVASAVPTVVVRARDDRGRDVAGLRVLVDREPVTSYEEGRPFEIDPGPHTLRVEAQGRVVELELVAREGETARPVSVTFPAPAAAAPLAPVPSEAPIRPVPTSAWVFASVGVVGLGSFVTFGVIGFEKHDALRGSCAPRCNDDQKRPVVVDYAIGDLSLALSVVSFGVATWLFMTRPAARPTRARVVPWIGPARAGVGGAF